MSLLQEMEHYGLADCEFNRKLWQEDEIIKKILKLSDCIEDHLIIISKSDNNELITVCVKAIRKLENTIEKLREEL
jgi:hypothetical protein